MGQCYSDEKQIRTNDSTQVDLGNSVMIKQSYKARLPHEEKFTQYSVHNQVGNVMREEHKHRINDISGSVEETKGRVVIIQY